jgi:hypothetical protein
VYGLFASNKECEMSEENAHKLWEERAHRPFEPLFTASGKGIDTDAALRMAHAFEYIAAQLGQINRKLTRLTR